MVVQKVLLVGIVRSVGHGLLCFKKSFTIGIFRKPSFDAFV